MKNLFILIIGVIILSACNTSEDKGNESEDYAEYFYPTDSIIPFIYLFQEENNPLNEKMHRIYRLESAADTTLAVEIFNSEFRITEGFTYDVNDFSVEDHMVVDAEGLKRKAKLTSNTIFPLRNGEQSLFVSDFPSHLDSISMVYASKKSVIDDATEINVLGKNAPAIVVRDSVTVTMVNVYTKQGSSQQFAMDRVYAKGYGLVKWSLTDGSVVYELKNILSNKWWEEVAQAPSVRL